MDICLEQKRLMIRAGQRQRSKAMVREQLQPLQTDKSPINARKSQVFLLITLGVEPTLQVNFRQLKLL
jgi:hypothetical protein